MDDRTTAPGTGTAAVGETIVAGPAAAEAATAAVAGAGTRADEAAVVDEAAAVVEAAEAGEVMELDGERALTPLQREVITELQKVLLTLNQINELLLKAIRKKEAVEDAQKGAVESVRRVFGGVGGGGSE